MPNKARQDFLLTDVNGSPAWAAGFSVVVFDFGGQVSVGSSGSTINLHLGHGFTNNDKLFRLAPGEAPIIRQVFTTLGTSITLTNGESITVNFGDLLINLGSDTGSSLPNYDGSSITIYSDKNGDNAVSNSTVSTDEFGNYRYWVDDATTIWELYLDSLLIPQGVKIINA